MKKNKMMRTASGLLVATLLTTSIISGTFAKYVTTASGEDSARVAKWGFEGGNTIVLNELFKNAYTDDKNGETVKAAADVIAPGTSGSQTFGFTYGGDGNVTAPEVAYTFNVSTDGSTCDPDIQNNKDIVWSLDGKPAEATDKTTGSWEALTAAIEALDGNKNEDRYEPNTLPKAFESTGDNTHTVSWEWKFEGNNTYATNKSQDQYDTDMGNATDLANVKLKITVTATQID